MNSRDFRVLFLYEWKSKHNAAFVNGFVNECTIWRLLAKFETMRVSQRIVKKNPDNIVRDYAEKLSSSPTTILRHLNLFAKLKNG